MANTKLMINPKIDTRQIIRLKTPNHFLSSTNSIFSDPKQNRRKIKSRSDAKPNKASNIFTFSLEIFPRHKRY